MEIDRRSFLRAAGSSLVLGGGRVWSASAAAQTPAPPVSFPGIANPLEGGVDVIATGYIWSEGPVWVGGEDGHLLFSDVPGNAIYSWDGKRTTVFLAPSGYQGFPIPASLRESGSNGLTLGRGGLLIADSGTRVLARVDLATRQKTVIAESYQGKRFNSPNDLVVARNGDVYFTDPPFGLAGVQKSPLRELTYTGVFRLTPDNQVHLITDKLSPNGIALSPDNRTLYVTDSSGWVAIDLDGSGMPIGQRQFVASEKVGGARGDGMKADSAGNIWTSGRAAGSTCFHRRANTLVSLRSRVASRTARSGPAGTSTLATTRRSYVAAFAPTFPEDRQSSTDTAEDAWLRINGQSHGEMPSSV